jgi:hypothetical protein
MVNQPSPVAPIEPDSTNPPVRSRCFKGKIGVLLASAVISVVLCELALRIFFRDEKSAVSDPANLNYRYDPQLGWFPRSNSTTRVTASRTVTAIHNRDGLRGPERVEGNQPAVVFLGDSLVWGFDVEENERFTEKLQARHPEWTVYNFGVSGYGTDQEYLLLQRYFENYHPALVFLIICGDNDNEDNAWNFRGGCYKPYYTLEGGHLKVNGVPVARSARTFLAEHKFLAHSMMIRLCARAFYRLESPPPKKNPDPPTGALLLDMRKYVVERGALFAIGLQHSHAELEQFLRNFRIPYVDLSTTNSAHTYSAFGNHWTPEGHTFVANKIDAFLGRNETTNDTNKHE